MLLLPTPVRQTAHVYLPEFCKRSRSVPQIMTFVFPAFTLNPFFSMASFEKIRKAFSKFYHRHSELIVKYNIGLKTLLQLGISEPIFYGDLVYKFKRIVGKPYFSDQFKKIVKRYIRVGYNLDIMRQSACLVLNPITVL